MRLLARAAAPGASASDESEAVAASDEVFRQLAGELTRWFGPFGYHALVSRALAEAKRHHPALEDVRVQSANEPGLEGLAESIARHGSAAVTESIIATLIAFIDLLSRLIGEDMALQLLDQPVPLHGPEADAPEEGAAS